MQLKALDTNAALASAVTAAQAAGKLMRDNLNLPKRINQSSRHDIKLELDVRCQKRIEQALRKNFPAISVLGEEGVLGDPEAPTRWVVDPIDGTVNFTYGIPHACVSIALQTREAAFSKARGSQSLSPQLTSAPSRYRTVVGVVYDPFCNELWTAIRGERARLNGKPIRVSSHGKLEESIISLGFAKNKATLGRMLPVFNELVHRARKIRIMGAAALAMVYVASGRMDAYTEYGVRLWDIAAGGLILECAGGEFWHEAVAGEYTYSICANNGRLRRQLQRFG